MIPTVPSPLAGAVLIGQGLCREAYWDNQRRYCNWMGRSTAEASETDGPIVPTTAALPADLYCGSSGVALFLAQLFSLTGDQECRRTALAAIERSVRELGRQPDRNPSAALAFLGGDLGVAYAAARISALTGHDYLRDQVGTVLTRLSEAAGEPHLLDVMGGNAGAIPPLLLLGQTPAWSSCRSLAVSLGEELCRAATRQGNAWTWSAEKASGVGAGTVPLTGLSHGAAGIGLALLELHGATGRTDFLEGGRAAFAYEDALFNEEQGNWPDLRPDVTAPAGPRSPRYAVAWCHGAPGIGLARLRAISLDPLCRDAHARVANTALATTRRAVEKARQVERYDSTLCHGLAGLLEVLWIGGQILDCSETRAYVGHVAEELIQKYALFGDWPSGLPSAGPNPSLMLGAAGIGYQLLRLHDPTHVPPLLLISRSRSV